MRKINIENKCDRAICEAVKALRNDELEMDSYTRLSMLRYEIERIISILCITDDYVMEDNATYYCLSEVERNLSDYIEHKKLLERKRKGE